MNEIGHQEGNISFESVLIYGMGMMGASLALALRNSGSFHGKITGVVRSKRSASFIEQHGMADSVVVESDLERISEIPLDDYDVVILGLPVQSIVRILEIFPSYNGIITDMSSTRKDVHEAADKRSDLRFVGSHPMCGSEDQGPMAARGDLFHNRLCIITKGKKSGAKSEDEAKVIEFWNSVGMKTYSMAPSDHDQVLAYLSHSPHVLSGLMTIWAEKAGVVDQATGQSPIPITGGGFRDMARIAGSNPEMWTDILFTNKDAIVHSLNEYADDLKTLVAKIKSGDRKWWLDWFAGARKARNRLCGYPEDR
jgi:prephenate dehydrogenase